MICTLKRVSLTLLVSGPRMPPGGQRGGGPGREPLHEDDVGGEELCHGGGV